MGKAVIKFFIILEVIAMVSPVIAEETHSIRDQNIAAIHSSIASFSALADRNAYEYLVTLFDKSVTTDYSELFEGAKQTVSKETLMQQWAAFLPGFDRTFHRLERPVITIAADIATANVPFTASHWLDEDGFWQVSGTYTFTFKRYGRDWLITSVYLQKLDEEGSRSILAIAPMRAEGNLKRLKAELTVL
ncbi:nuclear transport factor 2 family protein [Alteromonas sp. 009811495]|uniref:nuclear transport factor 2 family protein n=1 Tax=Alteromonas sp. 009811495 TaxID=3002962 RepID=UPI00237D5B70|nr:nuclear transport factor 2 family protein [Alteromonas sp. 009811495]WDT84514.1 nuclear transport factor 2 family protein [Alteromonas sp. 009811495]